MNGAATSTMNVELQALYRSHFGQLVASITRITGDIGLAEDSIQDAFLKAADKWSNEPLPDYAAGWVTTTARNGALDVMRRTTSFNNRLPDVAYLEAIERSDQDDLSHLDNPAFADDMLRLVFTCCHPALNIEAQVALCLNTVCGLTTEQIAKAFIVTDATMSQRLWRAKTKIRDAGIAYRVPEPAELEARLDSVLAVVYLIFNEGWLASSGADGLRISLTDEALRLARLIMQLLPADLETRALLGLLLIQDSRRDARFDQAGHLILLGDQDRSQWDLPAIQEGTHLIQNVFRAGHGNSRYAIMGAIASVHANAPTAKATDWNEIATLYEHLMEIDPSAVVALNHAVAIGERDGPEAGLQQVMQLAESATMQRYYLFYSTQGEFLRRLNRTKPAQQAYARAIELTANESERAFLTAQYNALE